MADCGGRWSARLSLLLGIFGLLSYSPSFAHHSRSAFGLDDEIVVEGQVVEVAWTNPHYYLVIEATKGGAEWTFEGHSIPGLVRNGWSRDTVTVGNQIRVAANPNRDPHSRFALLNHITRTDGETYYAFRPRPLANASPPTPVTPSENFSGTWRVIRSLRANLVDGFIPPSDWPLTEKGQREVAKFALEDDPGMNCQPRGLPRMLEWPYAQQWQVTDESISIGIEHATETREIPFSKVDQAGSSDPRTLIDEQGLGSSMALQIGDKTLEIITSGFAAKFWGNARGLSSSGEKILLERYELIEDGYRLRLTYVITDPEYLQRPVEKVLEFRKVVDYAFAGEPPCDVRTARRHLEFE